MIGFFTGILVGLVACDGMYKNTDKKYRKERREIEQTYKEIYNSYEKTKKEYYELVQEYEQTKSMLDFYKNSYISGIDGDIKEAVKFAVKYSHPDMKLNNNTNEFIKFKKLYDKLK